MIENEDKRCEQCGGYVVSFSDSLCESSKLCDSRSESKSDNVGVCPDCYEGDEELTYCRVPTSPLGKALYEAEFGEAESERSQSLAVALAKFAHEVDRVERQASGEVRVYIRGSADDLEERISVEYNDG